MGDLRSGNFGKFGKIGKVVLEFSYLIDLPQNSAQLM